ncbi:MAG: tRNA epoxyqueuosine(34) reductase QueG [Crocinitomicaceae bacterium]|nr:tRNA epoxyqueuosine(34) reductase QueG [Crocinitomicaceae bacterium]
MSSKQKHTKLIRDKAYELGFMFCGISKAGYLEDEATSLEEYLKQNRNGKMEYLENYFDKRLDPTLLVEGAKSVVSLALNYYPEVKQPGNTYKISKYAYGVDYHYVVKDKLKELFQFIQDEIGEVNGRLFTDSAPVLEKAWATKSGIGWRGKNNLTIHPKVGSFFFLAELIIDLELEYDGPIKDYCGTCTKCIDACPTGALEPYKIDASKCISYLTIELKDAMIPNQFHNQLEDWMFGCDICQDVCPWNKFSKPHHEPAFLPNEHLFKLNAEDWEELTEEVYQEIFRKSPVKRAKYSGLMRNIETLKEAKKNRKN